jgi:hypothetical protein
MRILIGLIKKNLQPAKAFSTLTLKLENIFKNSNVQLTTEPAFLQHRCWWLVFYFPSQK